jgi:hypothetical protein
MIPTERMDDYRREAEPKCASPFCNQRIAVRGEFCRICSQQQQRHVAAMKKVRAERQSA